MLAIIRLAFLAMMAPVVLVAAVYGIAHWRTAGLILAFAAAPFVVAGVLDAMKQGKAERLQRPPPPDPDAEARRAFDPAARDPRLVRSSPRLPAARPWRAADFDDLARPR